MSGAALDTAMIFTTRMEELASFYQEGLGLEPFEATGADHLGRQVGPTYLGFDQVDSVAGAPQTAVHLWFTVDDLQETFDRFVALDAEVRYPPTEKPWGGVLAAVHDLDGNIVGLSQRRA